MSHRVSVVGPRGETLSVVAAGSGTPPLVLLHGFPLDHRMWSQQLEGLSMDHQVIAPEFRGFGKSTLSEPSFTLADLADDVEFIRRHLATEDRIVLCGLSMGGYVALEYWSKYAENLAGLVLANTKPGADDTAGQAARIEMARTALAQGTRAAVGGMLEKLLPAKFPKPSEVVSSVEAMMFSLPPASISAAQRAMAERRDFTPALSQIQLPTLVLTGSEDPIAPPEATQRWASQIPMAAYKAFDSAGHLTPLECPSEFNAAISEFVRTLPTSS